MSFSLQRYKAILSLGFPILVGQLGMIVVGFADTTMVGHYSTNALAAASFVNNIFNVAILACLGMTMGITPLAGALYSRKQYGRVGELIRNAVPVNLLFTLLLMSVMAVVYLNLHRLGQPEELLPIIRPYFIIYLVGMLPVIGFNVWAQWSYAINRTRMPMWIILGCNALNIFGNYLLIYGNWGFPELGLTGAGIATLVSRVVSAVVIISIFFVRKEYKEYARGFLTSAFRWPVIRRVTNTSWPVALQMTFESGSFTAAAVMVGWIGAVELASFQVIVITGTLGFCVYYSMAAAVAVIVSNDAGLGNRRGMRETAFSGYHILLALAVMASLFFIFGSHLLIRFFTSDPKVEACALTLIFPLVLYQLCDATQICFANSLRGTSHVMPMVGISFVSYVIVGIPATYVIGFPLGMGLYGIILSFSVSLFVAAVLFFYYFMRTTRPENPAISSSSTSSL